MKAYFALPESPPSDPLPTLMVTLNKDYSVYYWVTFWITENSQFWMRHWRAHCIFFLHSICSLLCFRRTNWNHQLNILREVSRKSRLNFLLQKDYTDQVPINQTNTVHTRKSFHIVLGIFWFFRMCHSVS